jgi:adenosyl cobinamide kinase/adenosyl cobinamide phosphate guanylyltransferase
MTLSNKISQQEYLKARVALTNIARSLKATKAQREEARKARTKLTLEFIGQNIIIVEERTKQFRDFIGVIENAIKSIGTDSPINALKTLKTIAENAHKLIDDETSGN